MGLSASYHIEGPLGEFDTDKKPCLEARYTFKNGWLQNPKDAKPVSSSVVYVCKERSPGSNTKTCVSSKKLTLAGSGPKNGQVLFSESALTPGDEYYWLEWRQERQGLMGLIFEEPLLATSDRFRVTNMDVKLQRRFEEQEKAMEARAKRERMETEAQAVQERRELKRQRDVYDGLQATIDRLHEDKETLVEMKVRAETAAKLAQEEIARLRKEKEVLEKQVQEIPESLKRKRSESDSGSLLSVDPELSPAGKGSKGSVPSGSHRDVDPAANHAVQPKGKNLSRQAKVPKKASGARTRPARRGLQVQTA